MTESLSAEANGQLGQELMHWASRSDLWQLAYRFTQLVNKINEPLRNSPFVDHIFTLEEEDFEPAAMRELRCSYCPEEVIQDRQEDGECHLKLKYHFFFCGSFN